MTSRTQSILVLCVFALTILLLYAASQGGLHPTRQGIV